MSRLFIPGPTDVDPAVSRAQTRPMVGHRSQEFVDLFARIQPKIRKVFQTENPVLVTASSGTGLWEGAVKNVVSERLLLLSCGAFGDRWYDVAVGNGIPVDRIESSWGQPNTPSQVIDTLKNKNYDTVAVVHNETSTGVENPVAEIVQSARSIQPELVIMVDAVSSLGGVDIKPDEWGIDILVTSSQKCLALPPGLAFASVSERALKRAQSIAHRGWYFDLLRLEKYMKRSMTPATPAISLLNALDDQLSRILEEGLEARFDRHSKMAVFIRDWAAERFKLFAAEGHRSNTVTTILNTREVDIPHLNNFLAEHEMVIANGYGKLKGETFRIGHMGETQLSDLEILIGRIDQFLDLQSR
ncbi:MAG: aminotransferase class V-fold PLP-dependent enzyme [Anaerolineales bacterium]|nr:aminotransferase class V-fold PLP-dependent enzyme [Anaerolineales bacterium]